VSSDLKISSRPRSSPGLFQGKIGALSHMEIFEIEQQKNFFTDMGVLGNPLSLNSKLLQG